MPITLPKDATESAIASLRDYLDKELEHPINELPARLLLEFILEEIGPSIYNAAVTDAQTYMRDRVADLDGACHMPEFAVSRRTGKRTRR